MAVWGNYVYVDEMGEVVDEQYQADPKQGLQNVKILQPEQEKSWGFAYSGSQSFTVSQSTRELSIPIQRCVIQIQFQRSGPIDINWEQTTRSN